MRGCELLTAAALLRPDAQAAGEGSGAAALLGGRDPGVLRGGFSNKRHLSRTDTGVDCVGTLPSIRLTMSATPLGVSAAPLRAVLPKDCRPPASCGRLPGGHFASAGAKSAWCFVCQAGLASAAQGLGEFPGRSRSRFFGEESSRCSLSSARLRGGGSFGTGPKPLAARPTGPLRQGDATGPDIPLAFFEGDSQKSSRSRALGNGLMGAHGKEAALSKTAGAEAEACRETTLPSPATCQGRRLKSSSTRRNSRGVGADAAWRGCQFAMPDVT